MKRILKENEFYIALSIILLCLIIGFVNKAFFTAGNIVDLLRSMIVPGMFALGVLVVIISGGIDVSFPAIAAFSMFTTTKLLFMMHYQGNVLLAFVIAGCIGIILGLINGVFIAFFKLPTFIVTLGTSSLYIGFMLTYIGNREISNIPKGMIEFSKFDIFKIVNKEGIVSGLPVSILITIVFLIIIWFILKRTMLGRGIYAIGGDRISAERVGFNIKAIQLFIYTFVGLISGIAGMMYTVKMRNCNPVELVGTEMAVIAAVVLGGARITGGYGSVIGTVFGVLLVTIMTNSLILLGIPSYWQRFVIGLLILIGTGITALQTNV